MTTTITMTFVQLQTSSINSTTSRIILYFYTYMFITRSYWHDSIQNQRIVLENSYIIYIKNIIIFTFTPSRHINSHEHQTNVITFFQYYLSFSFFLITTKILRRDCRYDRTNWSYETLECIY